MTEPDAITAEWRVLGGCLRGGAFVLHETTATLTPAHFSQPMLGIAFGVMLCIVQSGAPLDRQTLRWGLEKEGDFLSVVNVEEFVGSVLASVPTSAWVKDDAAKVVDFALQSRVHGTLSGLSAEAQVWRDSAAELLAHSQQALFAIDTAKTTDAPTHISETMPPLFDRLRERYDSPQKLVGLTTGIGPLDNATGGLRPGSLFILAARPGVGKTTLAGNIAVNAALAGAHVLFFSREMTQDELQERFLCAAALVDSHSLEEKTMTPADWRRLEAARDMLAGLPIAIDETSATLPQISDTCRRAKFRRELDLVVIDYVQLVQSGQRTENRVQEVGSITRALKMLAGELHVPILALSQLNRMVESRSDRVPMLSDLRESGSLEQDSNVVGLLYAANETNIETHEEDTAPSSDSDGEMFVLNIAKNRHGRRGTKVLLSFMPKYTRFTALEMRDF